MTNKYTCLATAVLAFDGVIFAAHNIDETDTCEGPSHWCCPLQNQQ